MKQTPKPPKTLTPEARKLWQAIFDESEMDAPALALLNILAESFDRMRQAQAHIKKNGIVFEEKTAAGNVHYRANPACAVERDAKSNLMRAWRLLGFDQVPPGVN